MANERIVYQVINQTREEMFFGSTDIHLEKTIEGLAKDTAGPASEWEQGDIVVWRPLTDLLPPEQAHAMAHELSSHEPPNKFAVIQWLAEAVPADS